jgi:hypothetical protein
MQERKRNNKNHTGQHHVTQRASSTANNNTTSIITQQKTNQTFFSKTTDRNRRRHDRNHGSICKLQPHHHTNRTRKVQIPHSLLSTSEDSKSMFFFLILPFPFCSYYHHCFQIISSLPCFISSNLQRTHQLTLFSHTARQIPPPPPLLPAPLNHRKTIRNPPLHTPNPPLLHLFPLVIPPSTPKTR